jgi:hypothetical protein
MNQLAKIRDLTIGATGEGHLVEVTDNHCFIKLIDALRERLHVSQAKSKMSSKEIVQCFIIISKYHDEIGDQCVCGQKNIKFIYLCRNILGGELFIVGDKCKDHWAKEDERIKEKCKSLERKLKREKFIREGIPHCSNCVRDTTNNRCLQCVDIIKYKKARLRIKRFIIKNCKKIIIKLKEKRKQEEVVPVKIYFPYKDKAKDYARKNKIYLEYKKGYMEMDSWWCKRKNLKLFKFDFKVKLYVFELNN